ncbi:hypothetical protein ABFC53_07865 [Stenotrophomonas pavanii]|uniref:hypothetical protein n=1 Tax=Stenotrophomonas pavanii TaxID=487698 RepID=UPI00320C1871
MNTNDKTLANVQPGGMVMLGDQAERARFEAWGRTEGLPLARAKLGGYAFEVTAKAWRAWQYLSAQPSQGGQGDALVKAAMTIANAAHDRALMSDILSGMRAHEAQSLESAILALDAALAARQPVGEPVAWYYGFSDTGEAGPVTFGGTPGAEAIAWAERHGHTLHYLYAAPPAQVVDLAENMLSVLIEEGVLSRNGRVFKKLRALIDSQAVGK